MKKFTCALALMTLLCSCTEDVDSQKAKNNAESSCTTGKCDNPGQLEVTPLEAVALDKLVSCEVKRDTSTTDEFFQADTITCRYNSVPVDGVGVQVVIVEIKDKDGDFVKSESWSNDELKDPQEVAFRVRPSDYPFKLRTRIHWRGQGFGISGDIDAPRDELFSGGSYGVEVPITRPAESAEVVIAPELELWPIVIWPTQELEDAWKAKERSFWYGTLRGNVEIPRGEGFEVPNNGGPNFLFPYSHALIARSSNESLTPLSQIKLFIPAIPGEPSTAVMEMEWGTSQDKMGTVLTKPGYYLLEEDGSLTEATVEQVRERGARQTTPPPVITTPDMDADLGPDSPDADVDMPVDEDMSPDMSSDMSEDMSPDEDMAPDMPVVKTCEVACSSSQVCVAGACVKLSEQYEASSCNSSPNRACDAGEDSDCATGHACIDGMCARLSCQYEASSCKSSPNRACDVDAQCATGHACVEGLCARLSCQYEASSCNSSPNRACDAGEDSDCATGHVCVDGMCARLSCQYQSSSCSTADRSCGVDAHCASNHTCNDDGVCQRNSCN